MVGGVRAELSVALLQTAPRFAQVDANLTALTDARSRTDADLAVSPELSAVGYGFDTPPPLLADDDPRLRALPPGTGVGYAAPGPGRPFNAYALGGVVQHKLHPVSYAPWNEHLVYAPGLDVPVHDVAGARVATLVCNDMWHPVMPWCAVHAGAEVLVVPVASLASGSVRDTWTTILEHTARLLQCYVVFVNRCGDDGGASFWGGSRVVGPHGEVLAALGDEPGVAVATLDLTGLRELRAQVPLLAESRPDLVAELLRRHPPRA